MPFLATAVLSLCHINGVFFNIFLQISPEDKLPLRPGKMLSFQAARDDKGKYIYEWVMFWLFEPVAQLFSLCCSWAFSDP